MYSFQMHKAEVSAEHHKQTERDFRSFEKQMRCLELYWNTESNTYALSTGSDSLHKKLISVCPWSLLANCEDRHKNLWLCRLRYTSLLHKTQVRGFKMDLSLRPRSRTQTEGAGSGSV